MAYEKVYYETTEEIRTRTRKGSITIDKDYTQVYSCFSKMSTRIKHGVSYQLLFWLLANRVNKDRGFAVDTGTFEDFNSFLKEHCSDCGISRPTFTRSIKELLFSDAITKIGKGSYYANAYGFWKGSAKERKAFLQEEGKYNRYKMLNPAPEIKEIQETYSK